MTARGALRLKRVRLRADVELRLYRERRRPEIKAFLSAMGEMYGWDTWTMLRHEGPGKPIVFEFSNVGGWEFTR